MASSAAAIFFWAAFALLLCARAVPLHAAAGGSNCDGANCWISLAGSRSAHDWTPQQLAAAKPAQLLKLEVDLLPNLNPNPFSFNCTPPVPLNASSCSSPPCPSMGKSFFFSPAIHDFGTCSGSFITDSIILTAGHCCMGVAGVWNPNITFFLDWNDGQYAAKYVPTELHVAQPWHDSLTRQYDWCFMKVEGSGPKHLPTAWAFDPNQFGDRGFSAFGWPAMPPYDGKYLYQAPGQCFGTSSMWPPSRFDPCTLKPPSSAMMYMTCNSMTPGCSGGPWYDPTNPSLGIFGLNSALILAPDQPEIFVSPYFGTDFHDSCQQVGACK